MKHSASLLKLQETVCDIQPSSHYTDYAIHAPFISLRQIILWSSGLRDCQHGLLHILDDREFEFEFCAGSKDSCVPQAASDHSDS